MKPSVNANGKNVLIAYFTRTENTRAVAEQINKSIGGDIVEIQPATPYPEEYGVLVKQAKEELHSGYRPPLKTNDLDISKYDIVFVGSPNWCNTIVPPVMTFLSQYDFTGKTIAPFITHGGGGIGRSVEDIEALCPGATVVDGMAAHGEGPTTGRNEVDKWLRELEI